MARVLFAGNKRRGVVCLQALAAAGHEIAGVLAHPPTGTTSEVTVADAARQMGVPVFEPRDPNDPAFVARLASLRADIVALAGYSPILREPFLGLASLGCVNLHGGKLPEYRGSSPMNWALINGETSFTISVIRVDRGVDTGDVLAERTFPIGPLDTIAEIQDVADRHFPEMLCDVVASAAAGTAEGWVQDEQRARYFPLRFPDDGLLLFDQLTAEQVHNRVRALTRPYPCAFSFVGARRVRLLGSRPARRTYHGEPGRVYLKNAHGLLVCASDRCLWIEQALFDDGTDAVAAVARYDQFATVRGAVLRGYTESTG